MRSGDRFPIRALLLSAVLLVASAAATMAAAEGYVAPDVVVIGEPTLEPALAAVGALWRAKTGVPVHIFVSPTTLMLEQIAHGVRSDIVVGQGDAAAASALERQLIKPNPRGGGWRNRLVVATRGANSTPTTPDSYRVALAGAAPIALVDAPVSADGVAARQALEALGLWEELQAHAVGTASTLDSVYLLTHKKVGLALVYATDVVAHPALGDGGILPDNSYAPIIYWWAETTQVRSPRADDFASFLRDPQALARLRAAGLEVPQ